MAAYVIADIEVTDPEGNAEYRALAGPTVAAHGGKYIVRGGTVETLEGDWHPSRFVIVEFPSMERARAWYTSPEYQEALKVRQRTANSKFILVEGLS
jgi:uncharacterized protein (DUF1330 family)